MSTSHDHSHGHDHDPHHHNHHQGGIFNIIASALHLPGFGHHHDHGHTTIASEINAHDNALGIRTVWLALLILGATTVLQFIIYFSSNSVALLADTVHNLGDTLNSIPLLVALYLARRLPTKRYTYGFGRAEDIAGILIVISIAFSAGYILWESVQKFFNPQPLTHLPWIAAAAIIGFIGNELVAVMQIRVGKQIGSDAMIADGQHARIDGLTSLAVLIAVFGTLIGMPILDPIIGIIIAIAIVGITWNAIKTMWYRLMDAVDPEILHQLEHTLEHIQDIKKVQEIQARWLGHRLYVDLIIEVRGDQSVSDTHALLAHIEEHIRETYPTTGRVLVQVLPNSQ